MDRSSGRARNRCYTTVVPGGRDPPDWLQTEAFEGKTFVVDPRFRGVLPAMLDKLLAQRAATKQPLKREADPARRALRQ